MLGRDSTVGVKEFPASEGESLRKIAQFLLRKCVNNEDIPEIAQGVKRAKTPIDNLDGREAQTLQRPERGQGLERGKPQLLVDTAIDGKHFQSTKGRKGNETLDAGQEK